MDGWDEEDCSLTQEVLQQCDLMASQALEGDSSRDTAGARPTVANADDDFRVTASTKPDVQVCHSTFLHFFLCDSIRVLFCTCPV